MLQQFLSLYHVFLFWSRYPICFRERCFNALCTCVCGWDNKTSLKYWIFINMIWKTIVNGINFEAAQTYQVNNQPVAGFQAIMAWKFATWLFIWYIWMQHVPQLWPCQCLPLPCVYLACEFVVSTLDLPPCYLCHVLVLPALCFHCPCQYMAYCFICWKG